jgi:uncharacterized protein
MSVGQEEVIAFLADSGSYPGSGPVERLETDANLIFPAGDGAWKIERAVSLPYLDFSSFKKTMERAREVEVNRRGALELYLGCVPIVRSATTDSLGFGGEGEIVEWAVHYASF